MKIARRLAAGVMIAAGLFFILGDVLATPPALWLTIFFAALALALFAGAFFTWPRPVRPWRLDALIHSH